MSVLIFIFEQIKSLKTLKKTEVFATTTAVVKIIIFCWKTNQMSHRYINIPTILFLFCLAAVVFIILQTPDLSNCHLQLWIYKEKLLFFHKRAIHEVNCHNCVSLIIASYYNNMINPECNTVVKMETNMLFFNWMGKLRKTKLNGNHRI